MKEAIRCPVCLGDGAKDPLYGRYSIYRCPECSHTFYHSESLAEEVSSSYSPAYFKGDEYYDYRQEKKALARNFRARLGDILRLKTSGRLLEIGCAYGYFLELAKDIFEVEGIDVVEECVSQARKLAGDAVRLGQYLEQTEAPGRYDVVCMWDVVEHLSDARAVVAKTFRELKPGGVLALTTGDISSLVARFKGEKWRLIHPPSHVHYFSVTSMKRMLESAGFVDVRISHPGLHRSLGAAIYNVFCNDMNERRCHTGALGVSLAKALVGISIYMNLYDIMLVTASRPEQGDNGIGR